MNTSTSFSGTDQRIAATDALSYEECMHLLEEHKTPPHVVAHCRAVAHTALVLARALNEKGASLDLGLIREAGLLHDIARVEEHHETVGATWLRAIGRERAAEIVEVHMSYPGFHTATALDETDLVCLGDRLCKEDSYVGIEERIDYILAKHKNDPRAVRTILEKKQETQGLLGEIEGLLSVSVHELMAGHPLEEEAWT